MWPVLLLALLLAVPQPSAEITVLFVGNSLTSANDLPRMVERIGDADGRRVRVWSVTANDFGLAEHWTDGRAARELARRRPSFVVLQQGPSALPESRVILRDYAARFARLAAAAGSRPAFYTVWPSAPRRASDLDRVIESYRLAAEDTGALLLPAGAAWREAWSRDPRMPLYGADGFHPSAEGSWLAALVVYAGVTGRDPREVKLPRGFPSAADVYRDSAASALARTPDLKVGPTAGTGPR